MIISSNAAALYLMYSVNINQCNFYFAFNESTQNNWCPFAFKLLHIVNRELRELIQNDGVYFRRNRIWKQRLHANMQPGMFSQNHNTKQKTETRSLYNEEKWNWSCKLPWIEIQTSFGLAVHCYHLIQITIYFMSLARKRQPHER